MNPVHFSSERKDWETPWDFFNELDAEFHFDVDVCARADNAKCQQFITPEMDALNLEWRNFGSVGFMNPPYGREIGEWTSYARKSTFLNFTTVGLLPSRTDTKWWHRDVIDAKAEVRFLKGRLTFEGAPHPAPFPSAVVIWRANPFPFVNPRPDRRPEGYV